MKIAWEKWSRKSIINDGWDGDEEEYEDDNDIMTDSKAIMAIPMEIMEQMSHKLYSDDEYNFWTGYSDFWITDNLTKIISDTPGVESLDIITPYRWRIAIGKLFVPGVVMNAVNNNLIGALNGDSEQENDLLSS